MSITLAPIGVIRSEHTLAAATPIQPVFAKGCRGRAEIFSEYADGLRDLEGFSHIYLIYVFDRAHTSKLLVRPFLDDQVRGVFATRAPTRPNPIGLSIVELVGIEGNTVWTSWMAHRSWISSPIQPVLTASRTRATAGRMGLTTRPPPCAAAGGTSRRLATKESRQDSSALRSAPPMVTLAYFPTSR
jgi:tRNA-Thr(GGU) m(6)t(6)A37 methyltransferase TsaA